MNISISQTYAKIGMERTPLRLNVETSKAEISMHQNHAKVNITSEKPKVVIDQYESFASAGLKNAGDFTSEYANAGMQQSMEFIAKAVADGNVLAAIESGGGKGAQVAALAERNSAPTEHEFNIVCIPSVPPRVEVTGSLEIEAEKNEKNVEINSSPASININYTPETLNIMMTQYASVDIQYQGSNIDIYK